MTPQGARAGPFLVSLFLATACAPALPDPESSAYADVVAAFYRGVAAVQVGETEVATAAFRRVTELAPGEPAAWADLGLAALQRRDLDEAARSLARARRLAPENDGIALVSAVVAREQGHLDSAAHHLRRAAQLDPRNPRALYLLAQVIEQEGGARSPAQARELMQQILAVQPGNLVALLERARLAAQEHDARALGEALDRIAVRVGGAADFASELHAVRTVAQRGDFRRAATQISFLATAFQRFPGYDEDQDVLHTSPGGGDIILTRFLRLPAPSARPAPPDTGLEFVPDTLAIGTRPLAWVRAAWLSDDAPLALVAANGGTVWVSSDPARAERLAYPGRATGMTLLDYNYDFRMDLALVGPEGLRLFRQNDAGSFTDVTGAAIPAAVASGGYAAAWAADLDMEGDLDLVLARARGSPVVLRNRGDGRFEARETFAGVTDVSDFVWADVDGDGDPDAALLEKSGRLRILLNGRTRLPQFAPASRPIPDTLGRVEAIAAADWNEDATLDVLFLRGDGTVGRLSLTDSGWHAEALARWPEFPAPRAGATRLFVADLDNNGALDVLAATPRDTRVWLRTARGLEPQQHLGLEVTDVADLSGEGRLDLFAVSADGRPWWLANHGTKDYYSTTIRPRAATTTGDRRINPFGIGGEIEIRAGLLYQKQVINAPAVHFGLGEHASADVARIIWPNGSTQAEFNLAATNEAVVARQRLKGSCPWVFGFDGTAMAFVTDFIWRTALGLRINAVQGGGAAVVIHSEDWIKIRGDQLAAREGLYDVRITAELWETHFFDHVALMAVDHPAGTEIFVDERFTLPPPPLAVHAMDPLRSIAGAWDHRGRDVTPVVRERDGQFLESFALGPYQGIAEDHSVEVELGGDVPASAPLWLVASGWVYPTDGSINYAVGQGGHARPRGLELQVPDGRGGWATVERDLGMPAGRIKTILIDLSHAFPPGTPRRVRLRTSMEIYWDQIAWAVGRPDVPVETRRVLPATAELHYRGFSASQQARRTAPEVPQYDRIAATAPRWRDLVGYYTRFGDVRPLVEAVDDRYVIMNAGDELVLRFPALPPPRDGWVRDFVLIGDGWVKDGDLNDGFSDTVLPLPYHGLADYRRPPGRLEDDPAYRLHPDDWKVFHTRYVTPRDFHRALVPAPERAR